MRLIRTVLGFMVLVATTADAQPPAPTADQAGRGGRGSSAAPPSVQVAADRRVTFRLNAPGAREVVLDGNWPGGRGLRMTSDAAGVWTFTTDPLPAERWVYTYTVDGLTTIDLGNLGLVRDTTRYQSTFLVPGPDSTFLQTAAIPHGTVSAVWYPSTALKTDRRMVVYTPPGYERSSTRYPVLYLLHGGGGDEEQWSTLGDANVILDNLLAAGRVVPMIVVMPNANWHDVAALDIGGVRPAAGGGTDYALAERELAGDVVPFVETHYRALSGRDHRAIAGLSMGGGIAINVGLKRLDLFAHVAEFSAGIFGGVGAGTYSQFDLAKVAPGVVADPGTTNRRLRVLYFSCGTEDPRMPYQTTFVEGLRRQGITLTFKSYPGGHEWRVWRRSLADLIPMLFL